MIAPTIEKMNPADCPSWYQPTARPIQPARSAPAMPSSMVMMIPPGSFPGIINLAIAPTIKPMMAS